MQSRKKEGAKVTQASISLSWGKEMKETGLSQNSQVRGFHQCILGNKIYWTQAKHFQVFIIIAKNLRQVSSWIIRYGDI